LKSTTSYDDKYDDKIHTVCVPPKTQYLFLMRTNSLSLGFGREWENVNDHNETFIVYGFFGKITVLSLVFKKICYVYIYIISGGYHWIFFYKFAWWYIKDLTSFVLDYGWGIFLWGINFIINLLNVCFSFDWLK